jgi:hypothetical protein
MKETLPSIQCFGAKNASSCDPPRPLAPIAGGVGVRAKLGYCATLTFLSLYEEGEETGRRI